MRSLFRICLIGLAIILPVAAVAQSVTAFDGTYAGLSREVTADNQKGTCTHGDNPYTLTISNGVARMPWGTAGELQGQVTPTGALTMRSGSGSFIAHLDGQIDPSGKATAGVVVYNCGYRMVWQRH
jgi:hypothetical protein